MPTFVDPPWPIIEAQVNVRLGKIDRAVKDGAKGELERIGRDAEGLVRASIAVPYPPPSAPGSPPHRRTGRLLDSYEHKVTGGGSTFELAVGSGLFYSKFLEFGTRKMAPRPHLEPAFKVATVNLRARLVRAIAASVAAAAR